MKKIILLPLFALLMFTACQPKPQPINFGSDNCDYCRMMITEPEFGSQVVNNQGRAYTFDSIECMAAFDITTEEGGNIHSIWIPNFLDGDEWLDAQTAVYIHSETLRSPMGLYLSAYADLPSAEQMREEYGGEIISYEEVKQLVNREWLSGGQNQTH